MDNTVWWDELRPSRPGDEDALKAIWRAVFGDGDALIDAFFDTVYSPGDAVLALRDGALISAGYCLPGPRAGAMLCPYIYAMATYEEHRGRGAGRAVGELLIRRAFAAGADAVATLPADQGLTRWYASCFGMAPAFRKGGAGVLFPRSWSAFGAACGEHDPETPERLWAVLRSGESPEALGALGWEQTFD